MSLRCLYVLLFSLTWSWVNSVDSARAQSVSTVNVSERLIRKTYDVADLVVPLPGRTDNDSRQALEGPLLHVITSTVARASWQAAGGAGTLQYFPVSRELVVTQSATVHEEIAQLLTALRGMQDTQVSVEISFVHVSPATARCFRSAMEKEGQLVRACRHPGKADSASGAHGYFSMKDAQVRELIQTAQESCGTVVYAPRITMCTGQQARLGTQGDSTVVLDPDHTGQTTMGEGYSCEMVSLVEPDSRLVRLALELKHRMKGRGQTSVHLTQAARTFTLASDRTLVWHLGETVPTLTSAWCEAVSSWLGVSLDEWLACPATERQHLFVLVKPHLLMAEETARPKLALSEEEQSVREQLVREQLVREQPVCEQPVREVRVPELPVRDARESEKTMGLEMRLVEMAPATAGRWLRQMEQQARKDGTTKEPAVDAVPFAAMAEAPLQALLALARQDRSFTTLQVPGLTLRHGQRVHFECVHRQTASTEFRAVEAQPTRTPTTGTYEVKRDASAAFVPTRSSQEKVVGGWRCQVQSAVVPDRQSVLLSLMLTQQFMTEDARAVLCSASSTQNLTVCMALDRTMVWHLGVQPGTRQHLFVLVTPRLPTVNEEETSTTRQMSH